MRIQGFDKYSPGSYRYFLTQPPNADMGVIEYVINPGIRKFQEEFGVLVEELNWGDHIPDTDDKTPYVLAGPLKIVRSEPGIVRNDILLPTNVNYLGELASLGAKVNVVSAYEALGPDATRWLGELVRNGALAPGWDTDIPNFDGEIGVNTIYPDNLLTPSKLTICAEDVEDNARCETFRLAFKNERSRSPNALKALAKARGEAKDTIKLVATKINEAKLWHRAPTDGAIFIKTSQGWLSSQTSTSKPGITPEDFSLILSFDKEENIIFSAGNEPPSSDSPEFLVALDEIPELEHVRLAVHFHSNGITRLSENPDIAKHRTPETIRYGRFNSSDQVVEAFVQINSSWIILKEHGVFWTGPNYSAFESFVDSEDIAEAHKLAI